MYYVAQTSYIRLAIFWDFISCCRFGLWRFRSLAVSVCGLFGLWLFRSLAVPVCGRFGLWPFRSVAVWPFRFVAVSVVAFSVCGRYDLLPFDALGFIVIAQHCFIVNKYQYA